jgi:hypothetical protein
MQRQNTFYSLFEILLGDGGETVWFGGVHGFHSHKAGNTHLVEPFLADPRGLWAWCMPQLSQSGWCVEMAEGEWLRPPVVIDAGAAALLWGFKLAGGYTPHGLKRHGLLVLMKLM